VLSDLSVLVPSMRVFGRGRKSQVETLRIPEGDALSSSDTRSSVDQFPSCQLLRAAASANATADRPVNMRWAATTMIRPSGRRAAARTRWTAIRIATHLAVDHMKQQRLWRDVPEDYAPAKKIRRRPTGVGFDDAANEDVDEDEDELVDSVVSDCADCAVAICVPLDGADACLHLDRDQLCHISCHGLAGIVASLLLSLNLANALLGCGAASSADTARNISLRAEPLNDATSVAGDDDECVIAEAMPWLLASLLASACLAATLPQLQSALARDDDDDRGMCAGCLLGMIQPPRLRREQLPWTGLWLALPAHLAFLVPVVASSCTAVTLLSAGLFYWGCSLQTTLSRHDTIVVGLTVNGAVAGFVGPMASWMALVRHSITFHWRTG